MSGARARTANARSFGGGVALVVCAGLVLGGGCRDKGSASVAELVEASGDCQANDAAHDGAWTAAGVGARFHDGDALRTGAAGRAQLRLGSGGGLRVGARSLVRFGRRSGASLRLALEMGEAEVEGGIDGVALVIGAGSAVVEPGARVKMRTGELESRLEVMVGAARLEGVGATAEALAGGDSITVGVGGAVIERSQGSAAAGARAGASPDAGVPDAGTVASQPLRITAMVLGRDASSRAPGAARFVPLPKGQAEVEPGTRVRIPKGGTLELRRGGEVAQTSGAGEVVVAPADGGLLASTSGRILVTSAGAEVRVRVPGGAIVARYTGGRESRAEIVVGKGGESRVVVLRGEAIVEGRGGRASIGAGDSVTLARNGTLEGDKQPERADFAITAGESAVIHDPRPPTAVKVVYTGLCPSVARVELMPKGRGRTSVGTGQGSAILGVAAGSYRYRVRCLEGEKSELSVQDGSLTVRKDRGTMPLPKTAPRNTIEADGRNYTVLYQNILPQLTVVWSGARGQAPYTLVMTSVGQKPRHKSAPAARLELGPGEIAEGIYRFWFLDARGKRSPETTMTIDFDNAAPAAFLREPANDAGWGATVKVSGVVLDGYAVTVNGAALPLDTHQRFTAEVAAPTEYDAIAVRFVHPARGVHYYLRRRGGPAR